MNIKKSLLPLFAAMTLSATAVPAADRPNIVIIYGDDVGYGDVGVYGAKLIPTPNIDKLASEGLVFTDGHCSAATCTPSRFSMLTGIHGFRHGVRVLPPNAPLKIKPDMFTLPQLFKKAGYETAVIGKWHLGLGDGKTPVDWNGDVKPGPLEVGFDYSFLLPSTNDRVPCVYVENHRVVNLDPGDPLFVGKKPAGIDCTEYPDGRRDRSAMTYYPSSHGHNNSVINGIGRIGYQWGGKSALWDDETMADEFVRQTKKYLALRTKERPFFLYFSSQDIHVPRAPHPRFRGKSKLTFRGDAMVQLDWATGEILKALDEHGLAENTLVIFSSDNGPVYDDGYEDGTTVRTSSQEVDRGHDGSGPYRGGKYQIYEGGTRVPLIVKWPGRIGPGISNALVNQIDFIASFAALLHIELGDNQAIDSRNVMPALLGKDDKGLSYTLEEARGQALRRGHWKYVRGKGKNAGALYNLETDIGEQNNVAQENAAVARQMKELLQQVIDAKRGIRQLDAANEPEKAQMRDHLRRKPLVLDRIKFHNLAEGRQLISDESWEPYISAATDDMLRFSIGLKADAPIPTGAQARKSFACRKYAEKVLEFTGEEQALLGRIVARVNELTGAAWPCVARLPWHFIKVDSSFCNGMAHTRGLAIVLSKRYLRRIASDEGFGLELLLHEKLHVVQRLNGPRFASLYEAYGFQKIKLADGALQRFNVAQNPDALQLDWAIQFDGTPAMLLTLLVPGKNGKFTFQTELRTLDSHCDGSFTIGQVRTEDEAFRKWRDSFPLRVGHDHPNEVSAYLSGVLLERDFLQIENEPLNEAHTQRVDQTRSAFRHILQIDGK